MSPEFDNQLCQKYPEIFQDRHGDMKKTLMCFGFEHDDGWFKLLDDMCSQIMDVCKSRNQSPPIAVQVKEKFGGLRFYVSYPDNCDFQVMYDFIQKAEHLSYKTCEVCGKPGQLRSRGRYGWLKTLCDEHAEELGFDTIVNIKEKP